MKSELGYEKGLRLHIEKERAAVKLQSNVGELLYEKGKQIYFTIFFDENLEIQKINLDLRPTVS